MEQITIHGQCKPRNGMSGPKKDGGWEIKFIIDPNDSSFQELPNLFNKKAFVELTIKVTGYGE